MRQDRFTIKSQEALEQAHSEAAKRGNPQVDTEHLMLALLSDPESICTEILKKLGADTRLGIPGTVQERLRDVPAANQREAENRQPTIN